ncbi:nudix hydrolase 17, mitochondrial isoform X5 [Salvia miltiorrhiza]|uniref:nudix hydrolase 17, mitochondrial isoform X5 n=1 Tax=Salvia miltiorrhiza TaxID=226208 RepID=UPI0025AC9C50|nr:nudix hydrolase 17, mitochondrial isoform X5 [Salvia miltiorrhiza]
MMLCMAARTGRNLQRYNNQHHRLVVGCIPYRYKCEKMNGSSEDELEVLVISSKKTEAMMFPKCELGRWVFKSKSRELYHQGFMFPLLVTQQLDLWPEHTARTREWMSVSEARKACQQWWMREALDILVNRLKSPSLEQKNQD